MCTNVTSDDTCLYKCLKCFQVTEHWEFLPASLWHITQSLKFQVDLNHNFRIIKSQKNLFLFSSNLPTVLYRYKAAIYWLPFTTAFHVLTQDLTFIGKIPEDSLKRRF
jgi:hypothetical protein